MKSKKSEKASEHKNVKVKQLVFINLRVRSSKWIVVACGKIVNERDGNYKQETVFKKYTEWKNPNITWHLKDYHKLAYITVNLGSIRFFAPSTHCSKQTNYKIRT